ncbi:MAG: hypothetical protein HQL41_19500 [Alphaproteobacteria bacterium]|nr:hypothetical protein [Alphaproteobacteria bacterium]
MVQRVTPTGTAPARFAPPEASQPNLRAAMGARVKEEAGRRILALAPDWKQRNATARAVELILKGESAWTPDEAAEAAEAAAIDALWNHVKSVRDASDAIERAINEAGDDDLPGLDLTAGWP